MTLTRVWVGLVSVVACVAFSVALGLAGGAKHRSSEQALHDLYRDQGELEYLLRSDARARVEALAALAADDHVRKLLYLSGPGASRRKRSIRAAQKEVRETLPGLNQALGELAGELLFLVDMRGSIVFAMGVKTVPEGAGLGEFPLVRQALEGVVSDDVWPWNNHYYRMAARPVMQRDRYVGAIVHGIRLDERFANKLGSRFRGASLLFSADGKSLGAAESNTLAESEAQEILALTRDPHAYKLDANEAGSGGKGTPSSKVPAKHVGASLVVLGALKGDGAGVPLVYALSQPMPALGDFANALASGAGSAVPMTFWLLVLLVGMVLLGSGLYLVWKEHSKPAKLFDAFAVSVAQGELERFPLHELNGDYRNLAERMNQAMDRMVRQLSSQGMASSPEQLDALLQQNRGEGGEFFEFAADAPTTQLPENGPGTAPMPGVPRKADTTAKGTMVGMGSVPKEPMGTSSTMLAPGATPAGATPAGTTPVGAPIPSPPTPPRKRASTQMMGATPGGQSPATSPATSPLASAAQARGSATIVGGVAQSPSGEQSPQTAGTGTLKVDGTPTKKRPETQMMAAQSPRNQPPSAQASNVQTPQEIPSKKKRAATQMLAQAPTSKEVVAVTGNTTDSDKLTPNQIAALTEEQQGFYEVYQKFLALKQECGEATEGITFQKFEGILLKNREAITRQHGATQVAFKVYIKDGRAALKATPIR